MNLYFWWFQIIKYNFLILLYFICGSYITEILWKTAIHIYWKFLPLAHLIIPSSKINWMDNVSAKKKSQNIYLRSSICTESLQGSAGTLTWLKHKSMYQYFQTWILNFSSTVHLRHPVEVWDKLYLRQAAVSINFISWRSEYTAHLGSWRFWNMELGGFWRIKAAKKNH